MELSQWQRVSECLVGSKNSQVTSAALLITTTARSNREDKDIFREEYSQCLSAHVRAQKHRGLETSQ